MAISIPTHDHVVDPICAGVRRCHTYLTRVTESKVRQMSGTQTIVLTLAVLIFGGGSLFYFLQVNHKVANKADCRAAATAMPLVNTTTGMGMSIAVAECE